MCAQTAAEAERACYCVVSLQRVLEWEICETPALALGGTRVAYGMLPRFGSKVGFVQPLTVYAGTVLSRLIASMSVAVLGNSWRKERCSPATSCGRVYLTNLAELEPAKGDSGVKR